MWQERFFAERKNSPFGKLFNLLQAVQKWAALCQQTYKNPGTKWSRKRVVLAGTSGEFLKTKFFRQLPAKNFFAKF